MIVIFTRIFRGLKTGEIWYSGQATLFSYSPTFFCIPTSSLGFLLWFDLQDNCCTPSSCSPLSPQIPSLVLFHIQYLHYLPVSLQLVISLFLVLVPLLPHRDAWTQDGDGGRQSRWRTKRALLSDTVVSGKSNKWLYSLGWGMHCISHC